METIADHSISLVAAAGFFAILGGTVVDDEVNSTVLIAGILMLVVSAGILLLLNLKAKNIGFAIALTLCQALGGIFIFFTTFIKLAFSFGSSDSSNGGSARLNTDAKVKAAAEEYNAQQAEIYAQNQGFSSADEAEDAGIDTGKKY